ncbi:glycogen phosphorylase [Thiocystis minor]|uniref:glycogen/starch/alpha-glucan phosphorylase n=1 Tax=Thiocystis minor TaxID=61597 RepID=UPI00191181AF|nr:glycogen/starch/alpha-glucan phosphorylase [Thiocystis minor]MBK5966976.1 glycogen phosphorylase [Thiocystis minor]
MNTVVQSDLLSGHEHTRTGLSQAALKQAFIDNLFYLQGRFPEVATTHDCYMAAAYTLRDRLLDRWVKTARSYKHSQARTVCYLSAEFLLGPHLVNNLINLGIMDSARAAGEELGLDFDAIVQEEEEPGLGNGGLGRLAACYLDSLATLEIPAIGYGIRYEFGIFDQTIENGWQVEHTDAWLRDGNPWEIYRPKLRFPVKFGGHTQQYDDDGHLRIRWIPDLVIEGRAYDTPILGYGVNNANLLRLWSAHATQSFNFQSFNTGDYYGAVRAKVEAETISKILYPNDEPEAGKELRLKQQYFFVSCSLQDMLRMQFNTTGSVENFHEKYSVQLNDTHPAVAVAELMRLLIDDYKMTWDPAWEITRNTFGYTNHTLLPEALETWSVELFGRILPRPLEIVYEINRCFLDEVRMHFLGDEARVARMSIIDEAQGRRVRMAHLATVGSFAVNGVAAMHSELVKSTILKDFHDLWPEKFHNVTNGVTPRRFIVAANPRLATLLTERLGSDAWVRDLSLLKSLEAHADDTGLHADWQAVKTAAKEDLSNWLGKHAGVTPDPASLFDVQAKRIHEYKRQHLNVLHIVTLYQRLKSNPHLDLPPRTFIFGGKAAPGYFMAKLIIKLINSVAEVINRDPQINGTLRVAFMPDFSVKNGQRLYPAADLSEQISLAGKEASGTGNMKFSMNGALTIGTLDGANVEIREEVGDENFFLFGLTAEQAQRHQAQGYRPWEFRNESEELRSALDLIDSGLFSHGDKDLFRPLTSSLIEYDPFMVLADFEHYVSRQSEVGHAWRDREHWNRMSILNVARMGKFSSDRSIRDYCEQIWKVQPAPADV